MGALRQRQGFTVIEVVVLVVVFGLLAVVAVPRFETLEIEARTAATQALGASLRSEAAHAHALWLAASRPATVSVKGEEVTLVNGYPDASTIDVTLPDVDGFAQRAGIGAAVFHKTGANGTCQVTYAEPVTLGVAPTITLDLSGC